MSDADSVAAIFASRLGLRVVAERRRSSGASRQTSVVDVDDHGAVRRLVLQRRRGAALSGSAGVALETALLRVARRAGVPVPDVVAAGEADGLPGGWLVVEFLEGETIPRRLLRDEQFEHARHQLTPQSARALARIHALEPGRLPGLPETDPLADPLAYLDATGEVRPVLEIAARWLTLTRPTPTGRGVVHGDFRLGNLLVDSAGLRGVLDWELAHRGDPAEDVGWLTAPAWRFGAPREVGGFGDLAEFLEEYNRAGGVSIEPSAVRWWQGFATLKWAVICALQAAAHLSGAARSVELAAIGRRVCESEWDLLVLMGVAPVVDPADAGATEPATTAFGRPTASELVSAVEGFLAEVAGSEDGAAGFDARVARNVLAIVRRELARGERSLEHHGSRLGALGYECDGALARAVRSGALDGQLVETAAVLAPSIVDQLLIANPRYLGLP